MTFVSQCCNGEICFCGLPAAHKVAEVVFDDDPRCAPQAIPNGGKEFTVTHCFHELTAYICDFHFNQIMHRSQAWQQQP